MINEEKLSKALHDFKTKYPSITSADLQTFIIGWQEAVKNCFIPDVSKRFSVNTYSIIDMNFSMYEHWSEGLNMIIEKDGITMKLNSDEIQQIVKSLPRTIGGCY